MTRFIRLIAAAGAMLALTGCASLFHDDFNTDTVNSPPSTSPAGPPPFDSVQILTGDPNCAIVKPEIFNRHNHYLRYNYSPTVCQLFFNGFETVMPPHEYWVSWQGAEHGSPPRLNFSAGNYNVGFASLEIKNHTFYAGGHAFGSVPTGGLHTIVMHVINPTPRIAGTYSVSIFKPHGGVLNSGSRPLPPPITSVPSNAIRLGMGYDNVSPQITANYRIDNVIISTRRSDMPQ